MPPPRRAAQAPAVHLYVSGDAGSKEVIAALAAKGQPVVIHDIREPDAEGKMPSLRFLQLHRRGTVPQLFDAKRQPIGNYEGAMAFIAALPAPAAASRRRNSVR